MPAGRFLLDSNIPLYTFDDESPSKQARAKALMEKATQTGEGCISMQVVQECLSWLSSKAKRKTTVAERRDYLENILEPLAKPLPPMPLYRDALSLQERWKFSFYDALIVAAALLLECDTLYSEDFQHGQRIEGLTIIDPFVEA